MQYFWCQTGAVALGFLLDLIFGDPHWLYHPVQLIGSLISKLEKVLLKDTDSDKKKFRNGALLAVLVTVLTGAVTILILFICYRISMTAGFIVESVMCYQILAVKSLRVESMKVYTALKQDGLPAARTAVSMIVGRDTAQLDEHGIVRAAVETVAENTSDGVIAPLFYMFFFGAAGGFIYKAVNTMDSMVGYKNEKYLYFGRAAAKLDDLVNYIPARLTGLAFAAAACLIPGMSGKNAFKIWRRDRRNHKSPNSAQSESACAGALGVQLAGDAWYFGELYHKPTIGDALRPIEPEDIPRANRLMYVASVLTLVVCAVAVALICCMFAPGGMGL